ncbi:hypothetical protein [Nocardioides psychrotolerans]|uniref:hypothetical protein n=1 Tax=Nocardioides psychrotolerans TaxID=1005945 RepID=UPI0011604B9E|nr:hypothetical protein [Nocardioides psychrotolerans]
MLQQFADTYRAAYNTKPHHATSITAAALGISRATAIRRLAAVRAAGLFVESKHGPKHARWTSDGPSWLACRHCREPWPCTSARDGETAVDGPHLCPELTESCSRCRPMLGLSPDTPAPVAPGPLCDDATAQDIAAHAAAVVAYTVATAAANPV